MLCSVAVLLGKVVSLLHDVIASTPIDRIKILTMIKRILGALIGAAGLMSIFGSIINGSFAKGLAGGPAATGYLVGLLLPIVLFLIGSFILLTFDSIKKKTFYEGFEIRKKQIACSNVLFIFFSALYIIALIGLFLVSSSYFTLILYLVPFMAFLGIFCLYSLPFNFFKKHINNYDSIVKDSHSNPDELVPASTDNSILTNGKALIFTDLFCVVPFDQVESIEKFKNSIEEDLVIKLVNGKKIAIYSKQFDSVNKVYEDYKAHN